MFPGCDPQRYLINIVRVFFASLMTTLYPLQGAELIVSPDTDLSAISRVLEQAQPGDTVIIRKGWYRVGNLVVNKPVTIIGEDYPLIDGENRYEIFTIKSDQVVIRGLFLQNSGISFIQENAAIKLDGVRNCQIENNIFQNNFFAVYLAKVAHSQVTGNRITGRAVRQSSAGNGIHLWNCREVEITRNEVKGHRDGIYLEFVEQGKVNENHCEGNLRYGLHFMYSDSCEYQKNTFQKNGAGVAVMYSAQVEMSANRFEDNWGPAAYGLLLKDIKRSIIMDNYFINNTVGIYAEASDNMLVEKNHFKQNGWAIRIMANSMNSIFRLNNFMENIFEVSTNSGNNSNIFVNNYWSKYQGYDLNRNGRGDIPHRPVRLFSLIVQDVPVSHILLGSLIVDVLDLVEKFIPAMVPESLVDPEPLIYRVP
jgi:nitrous oxidase accessory protein